jgi:hypothetical protein
MGIVAHDLIQVGHGARLRWRRSRSLRPRHDGCRVPIMPWAGVGRRCERTFDQASPGGGGRPLVGPAIHVPAASRRVLSYLDRTGYTLRFKGGSVASINAEPRQAALDTSDVPCPVKVETASRLLLTFGGALCGLDLGRVVFSWWAVFRGRRAGSTRPRIYMLVGFLVWWMVVSLVVSSPAVVARKVW